MRWVIAASMPSGVEHVDGVSSGYTDCASDRRIDAFGR